MGSVPIPWNPASATPYNPYQNVNLGTSDPRKIARNTQGVNADQYANANSYATAIQDYLGGIIDPIAQGNGGYNPSEVANIEMTPEQQQNLVASSAIAAGTPTQAAAGAAQRATDASGGNPAAVAAYRARAGQQAGALAGNAATNAKVQAQQALSGETANVGQTRLGQQGQALNYLGGLQSEQNQNAQNAANRQVQGAQIGLQASQTPSTFDKITGAIAGGAGAAAGLDEGAPAGSMPSYRAMGASLPGTPPQGLPPADRFLDGGRMAVVAEKDPEAVVKMPDYMDDGGPMMGGGLDSTTAPIGGTNVGGTVTSSGPSFWQRLQDQMRQSMQQGQQGAMPQGATSPKAGLAGSGPGNLGKIAGSVGRIAAGFGDEGMMGSDPVIDHLRSMNQPPSTTFSGDDIAGKFLPGNVATMTTKDHRQWQADRNKLPGSVASDKATLDRMKNTPAFRDEGGMMADNGAIFTKPTKLSLEPDEAVVPLSYRANAKTRPSMAMPLVDKIRSGYKGLSKGMAGREPQRLSHAQ